MVILGLWTSVDVVRSTFGNRHVLQIKLRARVLSKNRLWATRLIKEGIRETKPGSHPRSVFRLRHVAIKTGTVM